MIRRGILNIANACLRPFKLRLQRTTQATRERMSDGLQHLIEKGCQPNTCIDVGSAHGTPDLYAAFPKAKHLLIEPLAEYAPEINKILNKYDCYYVQAAAGSMPGTLKINVKERITGSSAFSEQPGIPQGTPREVPVVTLDLVCRERNLSGPYLIKIDVEGAEMEVIRGAKNIMSETLAFILELTFVARLVRAPEAGEVIRFMADRDFVLYDIFDLRLRENHALFQANAIFVPHNSRLRT
ncbi:MAG: FkbM family methyltransferase [Deltaproteobacteria bacterium]|nr:FkbM family methyltransferase [Deltaproteobacteria bacterium]